MKILSRLRQWLKQKLESVPRCDRCGEPLTIEDLAKGRRRHLGCNTTFDP